MGLNVNILNGNGVLRILVVELKHLGCAAIAAFILAFAIGDLTNNVSNGEDDWNYDYLFVCYCIMQSLTVGFGLYSTLIFSFMGLKLKRMQGTDQWVGNHLGLDHCVSHEWYKDKSWRP